MTSMIGRRLLHYEITEKLGEGGMGVVYKARDTHLDRFVAIKLLPPERVADPARKARFVQEAKAASALNHPNIVVVHDIAADKSGDITHDFIVMEFVAGKTLDQMIPRKGMRLNEALKAAVQIADALARAHQAGIIHRDVKPANIMVDAYGLVKVLDFGLAKLTEREPSDDASTATIGVKTDEGAIVGTAAYMSPEQVEGKRLDARSDIFSLGAVLYEMATGRRAFQGDSKMSTLSAVLHKEPAPLGAEIPHDLAKLIARCLRKDADKRFHHMVDLRVALEEMKEESDSGALVTVAAPPARRRRRKVLSAAGTLVAVLAIGASAWFGFLRRAPSGAQPRVSVLAARAWGPALSPDGKQVAFAWNGEKQDNDDIYTQLVDEGAPRRLTTDPAFDFSPVWSPDGLRIAFLRTTPAGTEVLIVPAGGGPERKVYVSAVRCTFNPQGMARQICGLAWSPNGKFLSIVDKESPQAPNSIFLLDIETREKRKLTTPPAGWFGDGLSVFSPDGRMLAFARTRGPMPNDILVLPLSESGEPRGEPRQLTNDNTLICGVDWTEDGRSVVFASMRAGVSALWRVAASGGEPQRLTVGSESSYWPSVARKGNRLAYAVVALDFNIWRAAAPGTGAAGGAAAVPVKITHSPLWDAHPAFSPDGKKVAWASNQSGSFEIWTCASDGSQPTRLTSLKLDVLWPKWSPDGRQIAFASSTGGPPHVHVIGAEGGAPRRLTTGDFRETGPNWSRDGQWVYFTSNRDEGPAVWKVPASGGSPVLVVRKGWSPVFESSDGKSLYYSGPDATIWRTPVAGGEPALVLKRGRRAAWTLSALGIYILDPDAEGGPAIEFSPFAPGGGKQVLKLPGEPDGYVFLGGLAASPDGQWILYEHRDRNENDIMLVENFR